MPDYEQYIEPIRQLMREALFENWMDESDWAELEEEMLKEAGTSYEQAAQALVVGIENGFSAEFQFKLMRDLFKSWK